MYYCSRSGISLAQKSTRFASHYFLHRHCAFASFGIYSSHSLAARLAPSSIDEWWRNSSVTELGGHLLAGRLLEPATELVRLRSYQYCCAQVGMSRLTHKFLVVGTHFVAVDVVARLLPGELLSLVDRLKVLSVLTSSTL